MDDRAEAEAGEVLKRFVEMNELVLVLSGGLLLNSIFGMNIKQSVLLVRINTSVVTMNVLASGLSFTVISIGEANNDAIKEIKRALAM